MLTQTAEYALRVVIHLAGLAPEGSARAGELAAELDIPANYLSKILHHLAAEGILTSQRGRHGGFRLARPASRLRVAAVVAPFDDLERFRSCLLGATVCSERTACEAHQRWKPLAAGMLGFLERTTVDEMVRESPAAVGRRRRARLRVPSSG